MSTPPAAAPKPAAPAAPAAAKPAPAKPGAPAGPEPGALHRTFEERARDALDGRGTMKNVVQYVVKPPRILDAVRIAHDLGFTHLCLLTATDICPPGIVPLPPGAKEPTVVLGDPPRIEVVYCFYDYATKNHLSFKVKVPREAPEVPSIVPVFKGADWLEREVWDLLGVRFAGHPNLKRLLLPEGWVGHPLRKDYDRTREQYVSLDEETGEDVVSFQEGQGW